VESDSRLVWRALGPYRRSLIVLLAITALTSLAETLSLGMILPLLRVVVEPLSDTGSKGAIIDYLLSPFPAEQHLLVVCIGMLLVFLCKNALSLFFEYYSTSFVARLQLFWSGKMLERFLRADFLHSVSQKQGVLLNNIVNEPKQASGAMRQLADFWARAVFSSSMVVILLVASWRATLLLALVSLAIVLALWRLTRRYSLLVGEKRVLLNQDLTGGVAEEIAGIRQVHTYGLADRMATEFGHRMERLVNLRVGFRVRSALPKSLLEVVIITFILATILFYRYVDPVSPVAIVPVLGLFVVSAEKLYQGLAIMLSRRMTVLSQLASLRVVQGMIDASELAGRKGGDPLPRLASEIRLESLDFEYEPGRPVFRALSLRIPAGRATALVGASGSGKSTACDLIAGLLDPSAGKIVVDGRDLASSDLESWRRQLGFVSQDTFLFNATIEENIRVGKREASPEEVLEAARAAGVAEFADDLPDGYATVLGDRGVALSGGQRQRIAIARALVRQPALLILDEATSGVDAEAEARILRAIRSRLAGETVVVLTHRLASLAMMDEIIVLKEGRVAELGSYGELIEADGEFQRLLRAHDVK